MSLATLFLIRTMKIYAFSGLGTDGRIFRQLALDHELIPVKWINPLPKEKLSSYAQRLGEQIDQSEPFALLGVSFGGMLVSELVKTLNPEKVILISSASTRFELPYIVTIARWFRLIKIIPARVYKPPRWVANLAFPFNSAQQKIAKGIISVMDYHFIKWAIGAIIVWDNEARPDNTIHIHGILDPIIPFKKRMDAEVIGTGHFIILKKAKDISKRVNSIVS